MFHFQAQSKSNIVLISLDNEKYIHNIESSNIYQIYSVLCTEYHIYRIIHTL